MSCAGYTMSDLDKESTASIKEQQFLRRSLRRIIIGQEIGPRTPRWRAAWKRAMFSYTDRLRQLRIESEEKDQVS
jgi:hypothetical protein